MLHSAQQRSPYAKTPHRGIKYSLQPTALYRSCTVVVAKFTKPSHLTFLGSIAEWYTSVSNCPLRLARESMFSTCPSDIPHKCNSRGDTTTKHAEIPQNSTTGAVRGRGEKGLRISIDTFREVTLGQVRRGKLRCVLHYRHEQRRTSAGEPHS